MDAVADPVPSGRETDWALIKLPEHAKSCLQLGPSKPCVNKATALLNKLKEHLTDWQLDDSTSLQWIRTCLDSQDNRKVSVLHPGQEIERKQNDTTAVVGDKPSRPQLMVQGTQTGITFHLQPSQTRSFTGGYIDKLDFDDILSGAIRLVVRLDRDRVETVGMLEYERRRVNELRELLDRKARHRLTVIPNLVQKEHEQCLQDIIELNWHVSFEIRQLWRLKGEVRIVEEENTLLKAEVERVNVLLALISEKIEMEGDKMAAIAYRQKLTDKELTQAKENLAHTEEKSFKTKLRVESEIEHMNRELENIGSRQVAANEGLGMAQQENVGLCKCYSDVQSRLMENKRKIEMVEKELMVEREKRTQVDDVLMLLKDELSKMEGDQWKLEDKNKELEDHCRGRHCELEEAHQELVGEMKAQSNTLMEARVRNDELEQEMDVMKEVTAACRKQEKDDIKSIDRAKHELVKVDSQLQVVLAQTNTLRDEHHNLTQTLKVEDMKLMGIEHSYKTTIQSLRKDLQKEIKLKILYEAKVMSNTSDLAKMKAEHHKKLDKAEKKMHLAARKEKSTSDVVTIIEEKKALLSNHAATLRSQLDSTTAELHSTKEELGPQQALLSARDQELRKNVGEKRERVHFVMEKVGLLRERLEDTVKSLKMVCRMEGNVRKIIEELEEKRNALQLMMEEEKEKEANWAKELEEVSVFSEEAREKNEQYLRDRMELLTYLKQDMHSALDDNQRLSEHYQSTLTRFVEVKRQALIVLEQKTEMESALRDLKQLLALQSRMCTAMRAYHEYCSHSSRRDLFKFLTQSRTNYLCLKQLKEQFEMVTQAMKIILNEYSQMQHKVRFRASHRISEKTAIQATNRTACSEDISSKRRLLDSGMNTQYSSADTTHDSNGTRAELRTSLECGDIVSKDGNNRKPATNSTADFIPPVPCY